MESKGGQRSSLQTTFEYLCVNDIMAKSTDCDR